MRIFAPIVMGLVSYPSGYVDLNVYMTVNSTKKPGHAPIVLMGW